MAWKKADSFELSTAKCVGGGKENILPRATFKKEKERE